MYMYIPKLETVRPGAGKMKVISKKISIFGNVYFFIIGYSNAPFFSFLVVRVPVFSFFLFRHPPSLKPTTPHTIFSSAA